MHLHMRREVARVECIRSFELNTKSSKKENGRREKGTMKADGRDYSERDSEDDSRRGVSHSVRGGVLLYAIEYM
ncbi:hypothetical protein IAR55_000549 [Kwoniella newhampshirensis]|uniref:Uncharacterized protein n=1 Tax=Kwoniella newhampshirensis TaxID=1651941 RepID=A0AAW0Z708_9TREE